MSSGVVTPVVPAADDIVLGEVSLYANYELPNQLELGALQGGIKLQLARKIEDIKFDGAYGGQLDANGVPLKRYREFLVKLSLESLCLKYMNNKNISKCNSTDSWESGDWSGTGGTFTAESTIVLAGDQSAKFSGNTDAYGIHEVFSASKDLTAFDNSEVSTTADYICFAIYIATAEIAKLGTGIKILLHNDAELTKTNYKHYTVAKASLVNGWNVFKIAKSSFSTAGSGLWTGVTGVSFELSGSPTGTPVFYVDCISLLQNQSKSTIVPLNAAFFSMTDEGDYRKIVGNLTVSDNNYFENIAVVGKKHSGKNFIVICRHVSNDGKIERALKEKTEVVSGTEFLGHYTSYSPLTVPVTIRDYDV
ncbi:MAG: hypothetical protein EHM20_00035 [Alphaproteobacteria bacterium]|nr:MAG: hypothetical protein EHM20_12775 [Alphaproteobacteria bacterium]RPJ79812.1 MAG: hypothetical protein EHM20_00035 [Alphaproteobacteria bacterium]